MKASIVDLRYKMKEVLKALDRKEKVEILYHGKVKGTIFPQMNDSDINVKDHPFFGMHRARKKPVSREMDDLRSSRYDDL